MSKHRGARLATPLDVLVVALLVAGGAWLSWRLFATPRGERALVWIDGRRAAWFPIDGALRRDSVQGALGTVVLEHGNGSIRVVQSPCPGHLCMRQGAARRNGEKLVCVPSHVVVGIEGGTNAETDLDAIH